MKYKFLFTVHGGDGARRFVRDAMLWCWCRCGFRTVEPSGRNARRRRTCSGLQALSSRRPVCRRSEPSTTPLSSTSLPPPPVARPPVSRRRPKRAGRPPACTVTTTPPPCRIITPPYRVRPDRPGADRRCTRRWSPVTPCSAPRPAHTTTRRGRWLPPPGWSPVTVGRRQPLRLDAVLLLLSCTRLPASTAPSSSSSSSSNSS